MHTAEDEMGASGVYINKRLEDRLANHIKRGWDMWDAPGNWGSKSVAGKQYTGYLRTSGDFNSAAYRDCSAGTAASNLVIKSLFNTKHLLNTMLPQLRLLDQMIGRDNYLFSDINSILDKILRIRQKKRRLRNES
ncbi:hypothetical protein MASR2M70_03130 [Bacillota bacterium]